ncbi:MAG TPA: chemotaxis protein CheB [Puia sp.]|jgi:two-component system chemotaxis response regulator CheB|nr:chemotaxis protein CheB [Puia sp.]
MKPFKLIVVGGSAGSLQVILNFLAAIPSGFPLPILIVLHRNGLFESSLHELFSSRTTVPVKEVEEKEMAAPGTVYICPADYHVLLEKDHTFSLDYSERVNYSRPSIDVTFRSAADSFGDGLISLLLSGGNADGVEGLEYIKAKGGVVVVQDPVTADVPFMPQQAVLKGNVDYIVPAVEIPAFILGLSGFPRP